MNIKNPIIPGYNPDPSVVRVGDDIYVMNSSFCMYPGLPVYHSRDLVSWELKGYAFDRPSQLPLTPERLTGGLFAPTIRWHDGLFYAIVVNMSIGQTCVVTTDRVDGDWSEPHFLPAMFDPDIFWDDDGKCYVTYAAHGENFRNTIVTRRLDTEKWEMAGEEKYLWTSALVDAHAPEGPHIYKKDGWYYLLIAEGGTEHNHAVTIARSRSLFGPYEGDPANPILTHRHLSSAYPICNVGHADMVELKDGQWYMVFLGSRIYGGYHKLMGRETFIAPVIWEDGWPKVSPETGKCEWEYPAPNLPEQPFAPVPETDGFDGDRLGLVWNFIGTPVNDVYRLADSRLYLKAIAAPLRSVETGGGSPTLDRTAIEPRTKAFVSRRQTDINFRARCEVEFEPENAETAGIAIVQEAYNSLRVELALEDGRRVARAVKYRATPVEPGFNPRREIEEVVLGRTEVPAGKVTLEMEAQGLRFTFYAATADGRVKLAEGVDAGFMGSETAGGCVGAMVGMFCSGNGRDSQNEAAFDSFTYAGKQADA
jgi:xylan 1,4-beta-xylosidase